MARPISVKCKECAKLHFKAPRHFQNGAIAKGIPSCYNKGIEAGQKAYADRFTARYWQHAPPCGQSEAMPGGSGAAIGNLRVSGRVF